jgi:hypothetical protein
MLYFLFRVDKFVLRFAAVVCVLNRHHQFVIDRSTFLAERHDLTNLPR